MVQDYHDVTEYTSCVSSVNLPIEYCGVEVSGGERSILRVIVRADRIYFYLEGIFPRK